MGSSRFFILIACFISGIALACIEANDRKLFDTPLGTLPKACKPIDQVAFEKRFNHGVLPEHRTEIVLELDLNWDGQCEALTQNQHPAHKNTKKIIQQIDQSGPDSYARIETTPYRYEVIADVVGQWVKQYHRSEHSDWTSFVTVMAQDSDKSSKALLWEHNGKEYRVVKENVVSHVEPLAKDADAKGKHDVRYEER